MGSSENYLYLNAVLKVLKKFILKETLKGLKIIFVYCIFP